MMNARPPSQQAGSRRETPTKAPIRIVEVGPRDGLQNETKTVSLNDRTALVHQLVGAGLQSIEVGSFVSPKRVPQMADTAGLIENIPRVSGVSYSALVPNARGMEDALKSGVDEVAVFASASEAFSQNNINCSIDESLDRFRPVLEMAKSNGIRVRGYLSCALGCPYEGAVSTDAVVSVAKRLVEMGCHEVAVSDTNGIGTINATREVFGAVTSAIGRPATAAHFHDTRGQALANIMTCLELGVVTFDSSIAGLGGCPYAPGASGNIATEDLVFMLEGQGISTGADLRALVVTGLWISEKLGRQCMSKVSQAMLASGKLGLDHGRVQEADFLNAWSQSSDQRSLSSENRVAK